MSMCPAHIMDVLMLMQVSWLPPMSPHSWTLLRTLLTPLLGRWHWLIYRALPDINLDGTPLLAFVWTDCSPSDPLIRVSISWLSAYGNDNLSGWVSLVLFHEICVVVTEVLSCGANAAISNFLAWKWMRNEYLKFGLHPWNEIFMAWLRWFLLQLTFCLYVFKGHMKSKAAKNFEELN